MAYVKRRGGTRGSRRWWWVVGIALSSYIAPRKESSGGHLCYVVEFGCNMQKKRLCAVVLLSRRALDSSVFLTGVKLALELDPKLGLPSPCPLAGCSKLEIHETRLASTRIAHATGGYTMYLEHLSIRLESRPIPSIPSINQACLGIEGVLTDAIGQNLHT